MRACAAAFVLALVFPAPALGASPSDRFWNPFRHVDSNIFSTVTTTIWELVNEATENIGRTVSNFRIPDPAIVGARALSAYDRSFLGRKTGQRPTIAGDASPPSPIRDVPGVGTPCGGGSGDPYWAADCSCRCSRGGVANLSYEVSDRCPEDDNRACEDCRAITRHDKAITTIALCRDQFGSDPHGGSPSSDAFGL